MSSNVENPNTTLYNSSGTEVGTAGAPLRTDPTGSTTQPVSGTVTANLGTIGGAATEATLGTRLAEATFTARVNTLGQKTMVSSTPVVLASDQSAVSVAGPLTNAELRATPVPVSGTVTANAGTGPWPVTDNGGSLTVDGTVAATQSGTWTVQPGNTANTTPWLATINQGGNSATVTASNALKVDGSAVTQPISAASLPLPTGAATASNQTTPGSQTTKLNDGTNTAAVKAASTAAVATDPALVVAVSPNNSVAVTGTFWQATQPISAASLPLPTGAAQEHATAASPHAARLSDGAAFYDAAKTGQLPSALVGGRLDTNTGAWLGSTAPTVGQKASASSLPVVIASDQSTLPVTISTVRTIVGANGSASGAIAGTAGAQNLMSIENPVGSTVNVYIKRVVVSVVSNAAATTKYQYTLGRTTAVPTGGTILGIQKKRTSFATAQAITRQAPTATAVAGSIWTSAGMVSAANSTVLPQLLEAVNPQEEIDDIVLAPGEGLLVAATGNDTDITHSVSMTWQEGTG